MSAKQRFEQTLAAYHDGELGRLRRWWVERRLRRDADARRELESLDVLGDRLRADEPAAPAAPDVWDEIRQRLPAVHPAADRSPQGWLRPTLPWAGAALAAAALAAAAATALLFLAAPELIGRGAAPVAGNGAVRWLDSHGQPMMILQDDREATLIWVTDDEERVSRRGEAHGIS